MLILIIFINILCFSNKAISPKWFILLKYLLSLFSLVIWASNISMTLCNRATSMCAQGSSLCSWSNTRRKHGALVSSPPTDIAGEVEQPTDKVKMVFPNRLQKTLDPGKLEACLEELSSCLSAAWSAAFTHLNPVFRPKWSIITLSQAFHFSYFPCREWIFWKFPKHVVAKKSSSHHFETSRCGSPSQKHSTFGSVQLSTTGCSKIYSVKEPFKCNTFTMRRKQTGRGNSKHLHTLPSPYFFLRERGGKSNRLASLNTNPSLSLESSLI